MVTRLARAAMRHKSLQVSAGKTRALVAKLTRPTLRDLEPRHRLFQRLGELRASSPAVWIGAPAGAGKTSLLVSYIEACALPVLWYRIDERDQHVAELFFYLRLAAEAQEGSPRGSLELPVFSENVDLARFARRFFEALFLRLPAGGLLVFDDYHSTSVGAKWQAAFERCLTSIPEGINVVVLSRQAPPPALTRALAYGEVGVLESGELLLSQRETALLAKRRLGKKRKLSAEELREIHDATSGWAAGVSLLLRSGRGGSLATLSSRSVEPVFDFLTSAVFCELSPEAQTSLLHSACLRRFTLAELEELAGKPTDHSELLGLYRSGFFLESDGPGEEVFRFHPLFRSFLTYRAEQVLGSEELRRVRGRAARMLQAEGRNEEAFELLSLIDDRAAMCELVLSQAPALFQQGRTAMLSDWLLALGDTHATESGWLAYWRASCELTVAPSRSLQLFEDALASFEREQDGVGAYLAWAGAVQALTYEQRSFHLLERWLERLTGLERFSPAFASPDVGAAVINALVMGLTLSGAESTVLEHWIARALALAEMSSAPGARAMTASVLLLNFALRGDSGLASTLLATLERQTSSSPIAVIGQVIARAAAAALAWHQGNPAASVEAALAGLSLLDQTRVPMWQLALLVFGSFAAIDRGAVSEGQRFMKRLGEFAESGTPLEVSAYHVVRSCHAMARGDLKQALVSVELSLDRDRAVGFAYGQVVDLQIGAYLHFELGNEAAAREALREARSIEEAHRQPVLRYWRILIEADRAAQTGAPELAVALLREAFSVGRELQLYNAHCPAPARLAELCRLAISHDVERDYARTLIRRKDLFLHAAPVDLETWPWPLQIRTFGGLEVRVDDQPLPLGRVRTPLLLLRLLLTEAGNRLGHPIARVLAHLWPDADGDNATHAFDMTVLRLRNQLGEHGRRALRVERGHVMLDTRLCWTDASALSSLIAEVGSLEPEAARVGLQPARCAVLSERLVDLYRGPFAEEENAVAPLRDYAERVRGKVAGAAHTLSGRLAQLGDAAGREALHVRLVEADPALAPRLATAFGARSRRAGQV